MGHSIDIVPIPLARRRAPEKVLMHFTPAGSSNCATSPLAALAMNTGTRRATLSRSLSRISALDVRRTIMGGILSIEALDLQGIDIHRTTMYKASTYGHG